MSRTAICPGSFDPITEGHLDIIKRASKLFDEVIVLVAINPDKKTAFTAEERVNMIAIATEEIGNVKADSYHGLLIDYAKDKKASAIVKGLRAMSDFEYEFQMALTNKKLLPECETVFLTTSVQNMYMSSSLVKQLSKFGGDISEFVPKKLHDMVRDRLCKE